MTRVGSQRHSKKKKKSQNIVHFKLQFRIIDKPTEQIFILNAKLNDHKTRNGICWNYRQ